MIDGEFAGGLGERRIGFLEVSREREDDVFWIERRRRGHGIGVWR